MNCVVRRSQYIHVYMCICIYIYIYIYIYMYMHDMCVFIIYRNIYVNSSAGRERKGVEFGYCVFVTVCQETCF